MNIALATRIGGCPDFGRLGFRPEAGTQFDGREIIYDEYLDRMFTRCDTDGG